MIVWRFTMNLVVVVADGNLFDACLIAASAAISKGQLSTSLTPVESLCLTLPSAFAFGGSRSFGRSAAARGLHAPLAASFPAPAPLANFFVSFGVIPPLTKVFTNRATLAQPLSLILFQRSPRRPLCQ